MFQELFVLVSFAGAILYAVLQTRRHNVQYEIDRMEDGPASLEPFLELPVCTILNMDGQPDRDGDIFDPKGVTFADRVPLTLGTNFDYSGVIGEARLKNTGDKLVAELYQWASQNPVYVAHCYPSICGKLTERDGKIIKKCEITHVALDMVGNSDTRIKKLGEQGVTLINKISKA